MARVHRLLIVLAILASPSFAAEPKAVIKGKAAVPVGATVILDGRESVSDPDQPLAWKWKGVGPEPLYVTFDKDGRRNVVLMLPDPPVGMLRFALVAVGTPEGAPITADSDVFDVVVGPAPPPPEPVDPDPPPGPAPKPGPIPGFDAVAAALKFSRQMNNTFAASLELAAHEIRDGKPLEQVKADHVLRTKKGRDSAFNVTFEAVLDQIIPPGTADPTFEQRRRYAELFEAVAASMLKGGR